MCLVGLSLGQCTLMVGMVGTAMSTPLPLPQSAPPDNPRSLCIHLKVLSSPQNTFSNSILQKTESAVDAQLSSLDMKKNNHHGDTSPSTSHLSL